MKCMTKYLVSVSGVTLAALAVSPAYAEGTAAGSSITNTVTVNYEVGGVGQDAVTASDTFTVDRKINIVVAEEGNATTSVSPGQQNAVTTFLVTNSSNDIIDIRLAASQIVGGTAAHGGTDNFDVNNVEIYVDVNNDGVFDSAADSPVVTYLDEMARDETRRVFVVADVPLGRATGDVADVTLTGTAREGNDGVTGAEGAAITETTGGDTASEDTVFADADGVFDGIAFDDDDYTVQAAALSALKGSTILGVNYPITGATEFYNIPGATVEYCIAVTNAAGGADATNVAISDTLPANTTFVASSIVIGGSATIDDNGTPSNAADDTLTSCDNSTGSAGGSFAAGTVSATIGTVSAGTTEIVTFRAVID
ncbi:MAG: hypothetical protein ACTS1Z_14450 [Parasphingopyxis sp.]